MYVHTLLKKYRFKTHIEKKYIYWQLECRQAGEKLSKSLRREMRKPGKSRSKQGYG